MSEYPEALLERVAAAISEGIMWGDSYTDHAVRVLDALELRKERGPWPHYRHRYVTEWEPTQ